MALTGCESVMWELVRLPVTFSVVMALAVISRSLLAAASVRLSVVMLPAAPVNWPCQPVTTDLAEIELAAPARVRRPR